MFLGQNPLNKRHNGQRDSEIPNMTVEFFAVPQVTAPLKYKIKKSQRPT